MICTNFFIYILHVISFVSVCNGAIVANFTVIYDYVSSDEIVILQNAIEDIGAISSMPVVPYSIHSPDVPPPPLNVSATALSKSEINVTWTPVNFTSSNLTIVGYTVFYKRVLDPADTWQRLTTMHWNSSLILVNLMPHTTYTIRVVAFHAQGNGIASQFFDEKTLEGVPETKPQKFTCVSENPSTISLSWLIYNSTAWNGDAKGYIAWYRVYNSGTELNNITFSASARTGVLDELKQHTKYEMYLAAQTRVGSGPKTWCVIDTAEGVPSVGPKIIYWELTPNRPLEALVRWDPIPEEKINGRLSGYKIYYGVSRNGKIRIEYPDMKFITVDRYTSEVILRDLEPSMELTVEIAGLTRIGEGERSSPVYVETCTCPISIYTAWFSNKPYVYNTQDERDTLGIFPDYLNEMVNKLCAGCHGLRRSNSQKPSTLYWDRTKDGKNPKRKDEKDLKEKVGNNVHFHVAMFGRSEIENFQSSYKFVSIINSPGSAFIVRDPVAELDKTGAIMSSLFSCWPAVIIIVVLSMVAGIVVWLLDCESNAEEFPNESFIRGIYHGTYWAFVSMTTIGYGDKTPRSCMAQSVAIVWMLMGPIINGIVIGAITTSLTTINLESDPKIYGSVVGALAGSFEYNLGVRRNAKMNTTGKNYLETSELFNDIVARKIDGILIDSLVAADKADEMAKRNLKLSKIIPEASGWGIILSAEMIKLEPDIRTYVKAHESEMKELVANRTKGKLTIKSKPPSDLATGIVDPNSKLFKDFVYYGLVALIVLSIFGLTYSYGYLKMRRRKIVPFSQEHRELLENDLSGMMQKFCLQTMKMIKDTSANHESELKRFFWKKGYSFGIDAWFKQKTMTEETLKKDIRYQEIMFHDLQKEKALNRMSNVQRWKRGKKIISRAIRVMPSKTSTV